MRSCLMMASFFYFFDLGFDNILFFHIFAEHNY